MKLWQTVATAVFALIASLQSGPVLADQTITCESTHHQYNTCHIQDHGYVWLKRQTSNADCIQGRTWDYDKRQIWVDDNCKGEFVVESRHDYYSNNKHDDTGKVVAEAAAIAIIAGIAAASSKDEKSEPVSDRYADDRYQGSRHSSYVPDWMIGEFEGYNTHEEAQIDMTITEDGRMNAYVQGGHLKGYVNDDKLFVGDTEFYLKRLHDGFSTTQVGHYNNVVNYRRVD